MTIEDVEKLAELARIELAEDEKEALLKDFGSILGYIKSIEEAEFEEAAPDYDLINVWREDDSPGGGEPRQFSRDLIVGQFPERQDGYLKVKKIL